MRVVTSKEMKEIEERAIETQAIGLAELMERAGEAVAKEAVVDWVNTSGKQIVALCGKGHNGGDGLIASRILSMEGAKVSVFVAAAKSDLKGETKEALKRLNETNAVVKFSSTPEAIKAAIADADLVIDCLFGFGFSGALPEDIVEIIQIVNESDATVLAVDLPSGVEAESGRVNGVAIEADKTLALTLPKIGCILNPGAHFAGKLKIADIGITVLDDHLGRINVLEHSDYAKMLPKHDDEVHKHSRGTVLVLAGSIGMTGAATLAAQAALRSGAGIVTAAVPASLNTVFEIKLTEVMTAPMPETPNHSLSMQAFSDIAELAESFDVLAIGPGLSLDPSTVGLVRRVITEIDKAMVIDADALNALIGEAKNLRARRQPTVITPHPKELARLLQTTVDDIQQNRIDRAMETAKKWNTIVVLKGSRSIIAGPEGVSVINLTGNRGLATAGSGDVLTGMIAALLCQTGEAFESASLGVFLHGLAGDIAKDDVTEYCMVAHDVVNNIPAAFKSLVTR